MAAKTLPDTLLNSGKEDPAPPFFYPERDANMLYRDDCVAMQLPAGFSFLDRPNYCTWNFSRNESLIAVSALAGERVGKMERTIRNTKAIPGLGYQITGPCERELEKCRLVWIESVVQMPGKFYNKHAQIVLRAVDFSALVIINERSPYDVSGYVPLLESLRLSMKEVEAARRLFVPEEKMEARKRPGETSGVAPKVRLPPTLSYLQAAFDELSAAAPQDLGHEAGRFLPLLEEALRRPLQGLSFAAAEEQVEAARQELEHWLTSHAGAAPAGGFILDWLNLFIVAEILEPDDADRE